MSVYKNKKATSLLLLTFMSMLLSNVAYTKTYRWTDDNGKVHYTQSIPPSSSQFGHQELNEKNGMTINEVESSQVRKQRLKEVQLENEKNQLKKQALREELMIYMFSSRKELISHFEERLKMISVNIRLLQYHQKKLRNTITEAGKKIKTVKAEKLKSKLQKGLQDSQRSLIDHTRAIKTNEKDRSDVSAQMARSIKTYDEKFGGAQLNVGSLIGSGVLDKFRGKGITSSVASSAGMCSCPCTVKN